MVIFSSKFLKFQRFEHCAYFPSFFYIAVVPHVHCIKSQCTCHLHQYMTYHIVSSVESSVKCLSAMYHHNTLLTPVWSRDKHWTFASELWSPCNRDREWYFGAGNLTTHGPLKHGHLDPESNSWVGAQGKVMTSYHGSDYLKIGPRYEMLWELRSLNVNIVWLARADKHQSGWQWNQDQKSDNQRLACTTLRWFF